MSFAVRFFAFITAIFMLFTNVISGFTANKTPEDLTQVKNVIFMIGDGMGFNSIEKTRLENEVEEFAMDSFELRGENRTWSSSSLITDSAAGGTALACGVRTSNGCIGVYPFDTKPTYSYPMSLTDLAYDMGKATGVITTDSTSGATPAAFSAHTAARGNEEDITTQQMNSPFDLIWGKGTSSFSEEVVTDNGFIPVYNKWDMGLLLPGTRSFAQFSGDCWSQNPPEGMPTIAEMTAKAISLLAFDTDGFFLMVEAAHIDKHSHSNDGESMKDSVLAFDDAVEVALDFARLDGNTLVIVTADHETGGIALINGSYRYTNTGHTATNVPLFVYGCDNFIEDGQVINNKEVAIRTAACMGSEEAFPIQVVIDYSQEDESGG